MITFMVVLGPYERLIRKLGNEIVCACENVACAYLGSGQEEYLILRFVLRQ